MRYKRFVVLLAAAAALMGVMGAPCIPQEKTPSAAPKKIAIRAGHMIDGKSDTPVANALILIEGDKILSVSPGGTPPPGVRLLGYVPPSKVSGLYDSHDLLVMPSRMEPFDWLPPGA